MLRTVTARRIALPTLTRPLAARLMGSDGRTEGSVASSQGFSKKEKAHEDQYIRQQEAGRLQKLREAIAKQKEETAKLEQEHAELEKKVEEK